MVAGQRRDVGAQPLAGLQPAQHVAGELRALDVVAGKPPTSPSSRMTRGRGLGGVVQQRAPAQAHRRGAARRRAARRARRAARRRARRRAPGPGRARARSPPRAPRACGRGRRGRGSGSARRRRARRSPAARCAGAPTSSSSPMPAGAASPRAGLSSAKIRSPETRSSPPAAARAAAAVAGSIAKPSASARRATRTTRSGSSLERARTGHAQHPRVEVRAAAGGVDEVAARERLGDRVDGEVAQPQVRVQRAAVHRAEVDAPAPVRRQDPPRAELLRQREHRAARRPARRAVAAAGRRPRRRRSRSSTGRPSRRSRTAPPTIQAGSPREGRADAQRPRAGSPIAVRAAPAAAARR